MNLAGAIATGAALLVIGAAKFRRGAWIPIGLVPLVVLLFRRTRAHCEEVRRAAGPDEPLDLEGEQPPVVVVPIRSLDRIARKALRFALSISREVYAVQVVAGERARDDLRSRWRSLVEEPARAAGLPPPHLGGQHSRYREVVHPIVRYARDLANAAGRTVGVVVPELVERRWYHFILQGHTATALKMQLLFLGGPRVVIIDTPWYLRDRPHPPRAARRRAAARSSGEALPAPGAAR